MTLTEAVRSRAWGYLSPDVAAVADMFVVWFWLLITVFSDLFRRHDVSGWVKAIWVIALVVFPYLGIFAYLITQARGMTRVASESNLKP